VSGVRDARRLLRPFHAELATLLRALVRTDSVAVPPDGNETAAQRVLQAWLERKRVPVETYDTAFLERSKHELARRDRRYRGRRNLVSRTPGTGGGRSLLLSGHIDTVPAGRAPWKHGSPFSGAVSGGRLYGRGSWDMKGGLVAQFAVAAALKRGGVRLRGDLVCESVVDEEFGGGGGTLAGRLRGDRADACAVAEGTNYEVIRATRGGAVFDVICEAGDPMGYFSREEVVSPAVPIGRVLSFIDGWAARRKRVERSGGPYADFPDPAPVQVLAVEANTFDRDVPWSVPMLARVRAYFQFLPGEDLEAVLRDVEASLGDFARADAFFRRWPLRFERVLDPPLHGHEQPADHPWSACLLGAARGVVGDEARLAASQWPCDAFIHQRFGMPTLLFGPKGAGSHNANEYVEVRSVLRTAETYLAAALEWCA
jgi:acetylornithine deacetylase